MDRANPITSRVGYAESLDGVTFTRNPEPLIDATEPFEQKYGCEDARFFKCQGTYYTFYTGSKNGHIAECEATSTDGLHWKKLGVIADGAKNGALVCDPNGTPVKINGKYAMYIANAKYGVCYSDDLLTWGPRHLVRHEVTPGLGHPVRAVRGRRQLFARSSR